MIFYLLPFDLKGFAKKLRFSSVGGYFFYLLCLLSALPLCAQDPFVVVIDPGHGGKDPGNKGFQNKYTEKRIALNIGLAIGRKLEKQSGVKVLYTRQTDVFVDLIKRAEIANKADADLFLSIHCDAHTSQAYGAGTFVLGLHANQRNFEVSKRENSVIFYEENFEKNYEGFDPNNPESVIGLTLMQEAYLDQSIVAASKIQKRFVKNLGRKDRTVKQAGFIVLKYTYMPSVLVETGFLTNTKEGAYLNSTKGQGQLATAIADAVVDYKNTLQKSIANSVAQGTQINTRAPQKGAVLFRVQIAASKNSLAPKPFNFKGLSPIYKEENKGLYRYYFGETKDINQARKWQRVAKRKGYKSAFISAFSDGNKIPLNEALSKK
ncbi:MAG: N-acetylmuramoyl-L-alanine amidase family protein [Flavobacteriaceae bacterium]